MANKFLIKRSSVSSKNPATTDLALGELALNTYDGNLFFKKSPGGADAIVSVATLDGTQTLTNKTFTSPTINSATANNLVLTGTLSANNTPGTNGQYLKSTGTGVIWTTPPSTTLSALGDVVLNTPTANQVLTYTGSVWTNADSNALIASAVFAANAQTDLGYVYDSTIVSTEDLGFIIQSVGLIYDLGQLKLDGIVSLSNIDQSIKADYIAYSIIFGF